MKLVDVVNQEFANKNVEKFPYFKSGDTVAVHARIKEGDKTRVQVFQGTCIGIKRRGAVDGHFRVRKVAAGNMPVERVFPFHSHNIVEVKIVSAGKTRRAKHYYLRERSGKAARISVDYKSKRV